MKKLQSGLLNVFSSLLRILPVLHLCANTILLSRVLISSCWVTCEPRSHPDHLQRSDRWTAVPHVPLCAYAVGFLYKPGGCVCVSIRFGKEKVGSQRVGVGRKCPTNPPDLHGSGRPEVHFPQFGWFCLEHLGIIKQWQSRCLGDARRHWPLLGGCRVAGVAGVSVCLIVCVFCFFAYVRYDAVRGWSNVSL